MRLFRAALFTAAVFAGCLWSDVPPGAVYACKDGQCPQGYTCRDQHCFPLDACAPLTCAAAGKNCGELADGCGATLQCGTCGSGEQCGGAGVANVCACRPATAAEACADAGAACGQVTVADGCGATRVYACAACATGAVCRQNACCQSPTSAALCADAGYGCGRVTLTDACEQERALECGGCPNGQSCNADSSGTSCGPCTAETDVAFCDRQGANCGFVDAGDNCGLPRTAYCGDCAEDGGCSAVVQNLCACQPNLAGCLQGTQCCSGTCGDAGLCCVSPLGACTDDADCCLGSCAQNFCEAVSTNNNGR